MASVIKRRVIEELASYLGTIVAGDIPTADIVIQDAGSDAHACWPHLVVRWVNKMEFVPFEEDEIWATDALHSTQPNVQVLQVGDLSGEIEILLGTTNQALRETVEDKILHAFFNQQSHQGFNRPGVLVQQLDTFLVGGAASLADVPVGYALQTETWQEEMVFEKKRFSSLMLDVDMPALVRRTGMVNIETLVLAITNDLTSEDPELSDIEVAVDEDGALTPYDP